MADQDKKQRKGSKYYPHFNKSASGLNRGGVDIAGNFAYVAAESGDLKIYNITASPTLQYTVAVPGDALGVSLAVDTLTGSLVSYVTGIPATVSIVNLIP